jgi:hypothetical protein
MIATRTLSSERAALPLVEAMCFLSELVADGQDSVNDGQPGGRREEVDEPLERDTERREDQPARDDHDALRAAADSDVSLEADQLGLRPCVGDEEGSGDRGNAEDDADVIARVRKDQRDRGEDEPFADPVGQ